MFGEYLLKLTDKTADSVPKGLVLVFYKIIPSIRDKCLTRHTVGSQNNFRGQNWISNEKNVYKTQI
jgi:hypothetical protein